MDNYDSNDLLNEKVESIYKNVCDFYFKHKNVLNSTQDEKIETINSGMNDFTLFVRYRFKIEWKKSKKAE